jgi:hypothetical protein
LRDPFGQDGHHNFYNDSIYQIFSLEFGGFLAFDDESIHYYAKRKDNKIEKSFSKKLRMNVRITSVVKIDTLNPKIMLN